MSGIHLKDLSKVYKEKIAEKMHDSYLETDMKKRQKNNEKARKDMKKMGSMSNPHFGDGPTGSMSSEALDPVGKEDGDVNNDGKKDSTDSYLMKRRKAIGKAIKSKMSEGVRDMDPEKGTAERKARLEKKRGMKMDDHPQYKKEVGEGIDFKGAAREQARRDKIQAEKDKKSPSSKDYRLALRKFRPGASNAERAEGGRDVMREKGTSPIKKGKKMFEHSSWRKDLAEIMSDDIGDKPIKEKKNIKNTVKINPKLGESVEEIGGELIEAVEIFDILEEITDQELRFISDRMIDEIVEEFFLEAAEQEEDLEVLQQNLCESIDLSISLLLEQDAGAEARKRLGSGPSRASVMDRVKSAVKKGAKVARKGAVKGAELAGKAVGHTKNLVKDMGSAAKKGYQSTQSGSSSSPSSDSGSSSSGSSSTPEKKGPGLLSRIKSKLKKGIGKAARAVSRGARNVARKMDEAVYGGTPKEEPKDTRMTVTNADKRGNTPAYQRFKAGDKRYKAADHMGEGYKGKHGQTDKEYADSRSQGGKMISGDSKRSGAEYTHGRRVKAANPGMQPDVGGKTKPKSQGKMDKGTRADLEYRKANLKKEEMSPQEIQMQKKKATLDKMIAMKRKQQLDKSKAEPIKAMGEGKELSIADQMRISREAAKNRKPFDPEARQKQRAAQLKQMAKNAPKDTRTDAQKMTDATGPRPGSRYRGD